MTLEAFISALITSGISTLGFCLLLKLDLKRIPVAVIGGILTNAIYDIFLVMLGNFFAAAFIASLFMAIYSEACAKIFRAPAILFIIPSVIPIVPGSYLYYLGYNLIVNGHTNIFFYGKAALQIALGIAVGMAMASIIFSLSLHASQLARRLFKKNTN